MDIYIRPFSDLHLEFLNYNYDIPPLKTDKKTILILAGDIGVGIRAIDWVYNFRLHKRFYKIIYIAGNHEFYFNDINTLHNKIHFQINLYNMKNVHYLNNNVLIVKNYKFIGCTLWTNFNRKNPVDIIAVNSKLMDYSKITNDKNPVTPSDIYTIHEQSVLFLENEIMYNHDNYLKVIITHHSPSFNFDTNNNTLSAGFCSNLEYFFEYSIKYWIFGHTHLNIDMTIDNTRFITNQKGYPFETIKLFNDQLCLNLRR